jgi:hypothetical protein
VLNTEVILEIYARVVCDDLWNMSITCFPVQRIVFYIDMFEGHQPRQGGDIPDTVFESNEFSQIGQPCKSGNIADGIAANDHRLQLAEPGQTGDIADVVVMDIDILQAG